MTALLLLGALLAPATLPNHTGETFAGEPWTSASLKGKPALVSLWADWCAPCMDDLPQLEKLHAKYGAKGLKVVGVSIDSDPAPPKKTAAKLKLSFALVFDADATKTYGAEGVPLTLLYDADGALKWHSGDVIVADDPALVKAIEAVLK